MGALPKPEPASYIVEIDELDGQQIVRLPAGLHLEPTKWQLNRSGSGLSMQPVPKPLSGEELERWKADMQAFQEELGDLFPDGRNQPPMPEPRDIFPDEEN